VSTALIVVRVLASVPSKAADNPRGPCIMTAARRAKQNKLMKAAGVIAGMVAPLRGRIARDRQRLFRKVDDVEPT
jgi:hypothetical protein